VGKTEHKQPPAEEVKDPQIFSPAAYLSSVVFSFSSFLLIGAVLLVAAPRLARATTASITKSPFGTLGAGFVGLILPPVAAVMLFVTIIGIPLGFVLFMGWIITLLVGMVFTAQVVGRMIVRKLKWQDPWEHFASLVLGLFVLFLVALIPYIGGFVMFLAIIWGVGALWYTLIKRRGVGPVAEHGGKK
jgi:hypothetical protein